MEVESFKKVKIISKLVKSIKPYIIFSEFESKNYEAFERGTAWAWEDYNEKIRDRNFIEKKLGIPRDHIIPIHSICYKFEAFKTSDFELGSEELIQQFHILREFDNERGIVMLQKLLEYTEEID